MNRSASHLADGLFHVGKRFGRPRIPQASHLLVLDGGRKGMARFEQDAAAFNADYLKLLARLPAANKIMIV